LPHSLMPTPAPRPPSITGATTATKIFTREHEHEGT
jgi:hypothetical protein